MFIAHYLGMIHNGEEQLAEAFRFVAERHDREVDVREMCRRFAGWSAGSMEKIKPYANRYGMEDNPAPLQLRSGLFHGPRAGGLGLLHDLQDLSLLANAVRTNWTILRQVAMSVKDQELDLFSNEMGAQTDRQINWLCTMIKNVSPQAIIVSPDLPSEAAASLPKQPAV